MSILPVSSLMTRQEWSGKSTSCWIHIEWGVGVQIFCKHLAELGWILPKYGPPFFYHLAGGNRLILEIYLCLLAVLGSRNVLLGIDGKTKELTALHFTSPKISSKHTFFLPLIRDFLRLSVVFQGVFSCKGKLIFLLARKIYIHIKNYIY